MNLDYILAFILSFFNDHNCRHHLAKRSPDGICAHIAVRDRQVWQSWQEYRPLSKDRFPKQFVFSWAIGDALVGKLTIEYSHWQKRPTVIKPTTFKGPSISLAPHNLSAYPKDGFL
ncbi:hypothetical protein [Photobacterium lutimaris]|uniref:Uncharacterized protein n=1 Tax=Photobacterium lutimaris TaxID=388278 RepID=A0A2T3IY81_9GAMM|nr:hypothetical protein [Photobacterium lutimaris]PSU33555.1 hypothetical protein C9I99_12315 [Photobacterium lutimaris]TDR74606.1 hypothetical protein DFP78_107193 [Photobacterium lutimaris]